MDKRVASYIKEEYTKVELLKKTEHSSIWLAKDGTGQIVVVKQLSTTGLPFRKLKEIAHPLWPRILFTAEEDDTTWVVEEYVSGNTLSAEIETGRRFSPAEVKNIMLQLLEGMSAFHQAGIIHRDIKPSNIILQGERQARLLDFGVAREMHRENLPDTADELKAALLRPSYRRPSRIAALFLAACVIFGVGYWVQQQALPVLLFFEKNCKSRTRPTYSVGSVCYDVFKVPKGDING